jgi:hypothetical protein
LQHRNDIAMHESNLTANWGTLFNEFSNEKGLGSMLYYGIFFTRRMLFAFSLIFMKDIPIVQLAVNLALSMAVTSI